MDALLSMSRGFLYNLSMLKITIVGFGRVGASMVLALDGAGIPVQRVIVRGVGPKESMGGISRLTVTWDEWSILDSNVVIIATGDSDIAEVDQRLSSMDGIAECAVIHTSGLLSSDVLSNCREAGASVASMHPLSSFPDAATGSTRFKGVSFCLEGERSAVVVAEEIASALGGETFTIASEAKALYHAAAVMACGHLVALISESLNMLERCGLTRDVALTRLKPLVMGTVDNLFANGPSSSVTGPFARLDGMAVSKDMLAVDKMNDETLSIIFRNLGVITVKLALENGGDVDKGSKVLREILMEK